MTEDATGRTVPNSEDPRVMARLERERRILQQVIGIAGLVPVAAGLYGVLFGAGLTGDRLGVTGDSHYRYLSGLLLAIGLLFWSAIPAVEARGPRMRLLTLIVLGGGLARLASLALTGIPSLSMIGALGMELLVTPAVCLWQWRIARAYAVPDSTPPEVRHRGEAAEHRNDALLDASKPVRLPAAGEASAKPVSTPASSETS